MNLAGILGDAEADPDSLTGARSGVQVAAGYRGAGCRKEAGHLPRKKVSFFCLKWRVLVNSERCFFDNLGTICISVHHSKFWWTHSPCTSVIYAREREKFTSVIPVFSPARYCISTSTGVPALSATTGSVPSPCRRRDGRMGAARSFSGRRRWSRHGGRAVERRAGSVVVIGRRRETVDDQRQTVETGGVTSSI